MKRNCASEDSAIVVNYLKLGGFRGKSLAARVGHSRRVESEKCVNVGGGK